MNAGLEMRDFLVHMADLRLRVLRWVMVFLVVFVVLYFFKETVFAIIVAPLTSSGVQNVVTLGVTELFFTYIRTLGWLAFLLVLPILFLEIWWFVRPGLFPAERGWVGMLLLAVLPLFYSGMGLAYFGILPVALDFFVGFEQEGVLALPALSDYLGFVFLLMLSCGMAFNLPLFLVLVVRLGVVTLEQLMLARRWVLVGILVIAALLTPPDPVSLILLAVPLYGVFEGAILLLRWKWI